MIGVSDETLRRWVDQGKVRYIRLPSGRLRFRQADLEALLVVNEPEGAA
jgi:excisionase family DNA binding protein